MAKPAPQAIRVEAVELVASGEMGVRAAARKVGVSEASVSRWTQREGVAVTATTTPAAALEANAARHAARRARLAEQTGDLAEEALGRAGELMREGETREAKDLTVMGAILTDKHLLLTGEATSRHEVQRSPDEQRLRVAELLAGLEARRLDAGSQ